MSNANMKTQCINAVQATNLWCAPDAVKLIQNCDDVTKLVLPVSMVLLVPVLAATIKAGVQ